MKKFKVIIDTDPGVDDTNAHSFILNDPRFDIKLLTVSWGNVSLKNATRNMCHLLDLFNKDIPVVVGYDKRFGYNVEDATYIHGIEGLGGYIPPKTTKHKPIKNVEAADAIYEVLKKYPKQITLIVLGPHTTVGNLLIKHPDAKDLIKNILMMGGSPNGIALDPNYCSFNIRTDAPAFKLTVDSQIPVSLIPSRIGRERGHFTEEQVDIISKTNDIGKFLNIVYQTYWEPGYPDKRIATNDISAIYFLLHPRIYKYRRARVEVDTEKYIGKITVHEDKHGPFKVVDDMNREKFIKIIFKDLKKLSKIKLKYKQPKKQA